jgi:hypothetical protein
MPIDTILRLPPFESRSFLKKDLHRGNSPFFCLVLTVSRAQKAS